MSHSNGLNWFIRFLQYVRILQTPVILNHYIGISGYLCDKGHELSQMFFLISKSRLVFQDLLYNLKNSKVILNYFTADLLQIILFWIYLWGLLNSKVYDLAFAEQRNSGIFII